MPGRGKRNPDQPLANAVAVDESIPTWFQRYLESQEENRRQQEEFWRQQQQQIITTLSTNRANVSDTPETSDTGNQNQNTNVKSKLNTPARPPLLDSTTTFSKFRSWRNIWKDYSMLQKLEQFPLNIQQADFRSCLTEDMRNHLKCAIGIPEDNTFTIEEILDKIQQHFRQKRNVALDRVAFEGRKQEEGEDFDEFYVSIRKLAEEADLCEACVEQRLTTKIMASISQEDVRKKLLAVTPFPSLQTVVDICRSQEAASRDAKSLNGKVSIERIKKTNYQKNKTNQEKFLKKNCHRCGKEKHMFSNCPAKASKCHNCEKIGHWTEMCSLKKKSESKLQTTKQGKIGSIQIQDVHSAISQKTPRVKIKCKTTDGKNFCSTLAVPDTGAEISICGMNLVHKLQKTKKKLSPIKGQNLKAANGTSIETLGSITLEIQLHDSITIENVIVCKNQSELLLSWKACQNLNIISEDFPAQIKQLEIDRTSDQNMEGIIETKDMKTVLLEEFHDVFSSENHLKTMEGSPMKIHLTSDAQPFAIHNARPIPFAWKDEVKETLDDMVEKGILRQLEDEPTEWCHPMVVVPKPKGGVRICVDLTKLNKHVLRPRHPTVNTREAIRNISSEAKFFTTCDATHGYWQVPLEESSQALTTFLTPFGRYQYLRAPMGLTSTGDEYSRRGDEALNGIQNLQKVVDDVLLYDNHIETHTENVRKFLQRCRDKKITLNPKKFKFGQKEVDFVGYKVGTSGVTADPKKIEAIKKFPQPTSVTELRSFLGLVNQLGEFSSKISSTTTPLRGLLSTKNLFQWLPIHSQAFENTKEELCKPPTLKHFDPDRPTRIQTDASRLKGLGYALLQEYDDGWHLIQCGSRYLSPTESRYATIELELLAVTWSMDKCRLYLLGMKEFELIVDHRPLVSILDSKRLDEIENPRIQRLKEKLCLFSFKTTWVSGKKHAIPDALSRAPVDTPDRTDKEDEEESENHMRQIINIQEIINSDEDQDFNINPLENMAKSDDSYQQLKDSVVKGFPVDRKKSSSAILPYWNIRHSLSVDKELVLFGKRIVIPNNARKYVLKKLHSSHQGIEKTRRRARQVVYWPGINNDIATTVSSCAKCQEYRPSQCQEPIMSEPLPTRIFEEVSIDFFSQGGKEFLVYADRLSGWPTVVQFNRGDTKTHRLIHACRKCFSDLGVPVKLRSDGGPQFTSSAFKQFIRRYGVRHIISSPYYAQSNGHAEAAVKSIKTLISKTTINGNLNNDEYHEGLLEYRNTPREGGLSPAQIVFGHPLRSLVPAHQKSFDSKWSKLNNEFDRKISNLNKRTEKHYNKSSRPLESLKINCQVRLQNPASKRWDKIGIVVGIGRRRDYFVKLPCGKLVWRNRKFIRPTVESERDVTV